MMRSVAVVLGGYVNGYAIVRELHESGVSDIWLFDSGRSLARRSKKLAGVAKTDGTAKDLLEKLKALHEKYSFIVVFPTNDVQLEQLRDIREQVKDFCFLPLDHERLADQLDKYHQYQECERLGVPYPTTLSIDSVEDLDRLFGIPYPVLIKPKTREDLKRPVFRSLLIKDDGHLQDKRALLCEHLKHGVTFLASECIPGDDTNIYAYTAYRSKMKGILNEWIGKKLTQYPNEFGVFASASNEAPELIREQGRALVEGMGLVGIVEPEFKYDARDGRYKLMEINLRSMMWHRLGNLTGVKLQYSQWLDAHGEPVPRYVQDMSIKTHYVYMKHEIINLLLRRRYFKHFCFNLFGGRRRHFAVFDWSDIGPFLSDLYIMPRDFAAICLRLFRNR